MTAIILPIYNEGRLIARMLDGLETALSPLNEYRFTVFAVDDGSDDNTLQALNDYAFEAPHITLQVVSRPFNEGHQTAIADGISAALKTDAQNFIIMDSDGQDDPAVIPELLEYRDLDYVPVARSGRKDGVLFRFFYGIFLLKFRFITGQTMDCGNFCLISRRVAESLQGRHFVHLAAHLHQRRPARYKKITWPRQERLDGRSKMNFLGLVRYGFNALAEFREQFIFFFLKLSLTFIGLWLIGLAVVLYKKFISQEAILGWTSIMGSVLILAALICFGFFALGIVLLHQTKDRK
ncbi:MAG: glycosyltransferase [Candidatus Omnitrophota bacterium]